MEGGLSTPLIDLEQSIEQNPWSRFQKLILVFAALTFAVDGWANQILGVAIPALMQDWGLSRGAFASVAAAGLIGVASGTALGGIAGDRLGRRNTLIASILLFGSATMFSVLTHGVTTLGLIRFLDGLGLGAAIPNGAALVSEFTPMRRRSMAIGFCMTFSPVGGVLAGLAGSLLLPTLGWHALFLVTGGAALGLALLFFFVLPESPSFLIEHPHRKAELLQILGRFGYGFGSDAQFRRRPGKKAAAPFPALFGRSARRDTLGLWLCFFASMMASYSMFSWLPSLLSGQGFGLAEASLSMTAFNTGGMFGGVIVGLAFTAFGSWRPSLVVAVGATIGAVALGMIPLHPESGVALAMTIFTIEGLLVSGVQTSCYALAASVYPPFVRATGIGSAAAFGRLGSVLSSFAGVIAITLGGSSAYFLYIAGLLALCAVALLIIRSHTTPLAKTHPGKREAR